MAMFARLAACLGALASLAAVPALAQDSSGWVQGFNSRARLISGGLHEGRYLAGLEIVLAQGFKTYWRHPGDSGLPPRFEWAGSVNLKGVEVKYPVPARTPEAGGITHTYSERVVFPLVVSAADAKKAVRVQLKAEFGVCKEICIPAQAELALSLNNTGLWKPTIETALARVPRVQPVGAPGPLAILGAAPAPEQGAKLAVRVRAPAGTSPTLFAEGPDGWFFSPAADMIKREGDEGLFALEINERPKDAKGSVLLRLTLTAGEEAVESELRLDASQLPR